MGILIDRIRISGFRGLKDFEMTLSKTTVLTGTNNVGKTTILKAIQLALGSKSFLSIDDLFISNNEKADKIIIDIRIVPLNENEEIQSEFDEKWEAVFTSDIIQYFGDMACVPIRTTATYNAFKSDFDKTQTILKEWEPSEGDTWQNLKTTKTKINLEEIPFYYIEAQRDVVEDIKIRSSFLGKMLSEVSEAYDPDDMKALEDLILELNSEAVKKSSILSTIQSIMEGVDTAMDQNGSKVEITPFAKKIRDLNKNISIHYGENENSFTMDYHGMGTRSWSSLLTFKAFIVQNEKISLANDRPFFPIIAIEEPEAHLHPNAQKRLYCQMVEMPGQKIISTHSPYIASCADFEEMRGLYKIGESVKCGNINLDLLNEDDKRKLRQKVINTKGEIFFSKALVLFEGETEEQALPIMAEKYFGCPGSEMGIDFIGVGGAGQYLPFIKFAESLNIPWYIFSDGEDSPVKSMTTAVKQIKKENFTDINSENNIFIIDQKEDFERYIIRLNYCGDIKDYVKSIELPKCVNPQHRMSKEVEIENNYTDEYVLSESKIHKTKWALIFAHSIVRSEKAIPPLLSQLFDKIKSDLKYE